MEHTEKNPPLPPIIDHFGGFGLNDITIIDRDVRDADAGGVLGKNAV